MPARHFRRYFPIYLLRSLQRPSYADNDIAFTLYAMTCDQLDQSLARRKYEGFTPGQFQLLLDYLDWMKRQKGMQLEFAQRTLDDAAEFIQKLASGTNQTSGCPP